MWVHADLSVLADAPEAVGFPYAYTTPFNIPTDGTTTARVIYLGRDNNIHELKLPQTAGSGWTHSVLTASAPRAAGVVANRLTRPFAYVTLFDDSPQLSTTARVIYIGRDDSNIHELRLSDKVGSNWTHTDLSACPLSGSWFDSTNCFVASPPPGTHGFAYSGNLYYTPLAGNACPLSGTYFDGANCFVATSPPGTTPFVYNGNLYYSRFHSRAIGLPYAYTTSFDDPADSNSTARVLYLAQDDHIHELRLSSGSANHWSGADLTMLSNGRPAGTFVLAPAPSAYVTPYNNPGDTTATARVIYLGDDQTIHELRLAQSAGSNWQDADLSSAANTAPKSVSFPFGYTTPFNDAADSISTGRVLYLESYAQFNRDIRELRLPNASSSHWTDSDLTEITR